MANLKPKLASQNQLVETWVKSAPWYMKSSMIWGPNLTCLILEKSGPKSDPNSEAKIGLSKPLKSASRYMNSNMIWGPNPTCENLEKSGPESDPKSEAKIGLSKPTGGDLTKKCSPVKETCNDLRPKSDLPNFGEIWSQIWPQFWSQIWPLKTSWWRPD